jgi:hypothetical protein
MNAVASSRLADRGVMGPARSFVRKTGLTVARVRATNTPTRRSLSAHSKTVGVGAKMPVRQLTQGAHRGRHDGQTAAAPHLYASADGPALDRLVPMTCVAPIVDDG